MPCFFKLSMSTTSFGVYPFMPILMTLTMSWAQWLVNGQTESVTLFPRSDLIIDSCVIPDSVTHISKSCSARFT